jgi:sulfatase modifying factor 1
MLLIGRRRNMRFYLMLIILVFLCISMIGCADRYEGDARIKINLKLAPGEKQEVVITRVVVTVSGFDVETQEFELKVDGRKATGAIAIPAGEDRKITVKAYAGDSLEYEGESLVDHPKPGAEINVPITLKPIGSKTIFDNGNIGGVSSNPTKETTFSINESYVITSIRTYHWNGAKGSTPGTIALRGSDNKTYGPWKASGLDGQSGVQNAYWIVYPSVTIPAGNYTVIDSDPNTLAWNDLSDGQGFVQIIGYSATGGNGSGTDTSGNDAKMAFIPAGEFIMGSDEDEDSAKPAHTVYLDEFYIDMYEVTNAQYRKFVQATGRKEPEGYKFMDTGSLDAREAGFKPWSDASFNAGNMPVVCVTWDDANAYAKWAGKRLPTEAEWEKASRGGDVGQRYPWGNNYPPTYKVGNLADDAFLKAYKNVDVNIKGYNDGFTYVAPVGQFPANGYGLYDICGNVSEFCSDWYDEYYYATSPKQNPKGAVSGIAHTVRGSAWLFGDPNLVYNSMRGYIETPDAYNMLGFRCAKSTK